MHPETVQLNNFNIKYRVAQKNEAVWFSGL